MPIQCYAQFESGLSNMSLAGSIQMDPVTLNTYAAAISQYATQLGQIAATINGYAAQAAEIATKVNAISSQLGVPINGVSDSINSVAEKVTTVATAVETSSAQVDTAAKQVVAITACISPAPAIAPGTYTLWGAYTAAKSMIW